jgi:hypothetical protein
MMINNADEFALRIAIIYTQTETEKELN